MKRGIIPALLRRGLLLLMVAGLGQAGVAAAQGQGATPNYLDIFSGKPRIQQQQACESLQWAGVSDPRVYDLIEKNLLASYKQINDRYDTNYVAWLSRGLAFSGQEKYRATLQEVAANGGHRGVRNHAAKALDELDNYKRWNPILGNRAGYVAGKSDEVNRLGAMLRSNEKGLQRAAASRIHFGQLYDGWLLGTLEQTVKPTLGTDWQEKEDIDAVAWMLRALAGPGKPEYRATLEQAANGAASDKVRKYAAGYLKKYY